MSFPPHKAAGVLSDAGDGRFVDFEPPDFRGVGGALVRYRAPTLEAPRRTDTGARATFVRDSSDADRRTFPEMQAAPHHMARFSQR